MLAIFKVVIRAVAARIATATPNVVTPNVTAPGEPTLSPAAVGTITTIVLLSAVSLGWVAGMWSGVTWARGHVPMCPTCPTCPESVIVRAQLDTLAADPTVPTAFLETARWGSVPLEDDACAEDVTTPTDPE